VGKYIDYAVAQAYSTTSPEALQRRYDQISSWCTPDRFIVTENFESFWKDGGVNYKDPVEGIIPSLSGMANGILNRDQKGSRLLSDTI
jgi:hypothetical protein